jgi:pimeloyl-ACP methyl ester carboxylesterase
MKHSGGRISESEMQLKVDGVELHLQRQGSGQPLLFLHGAGGVPRWLPFFDALTAQFEVIVPDHPGFGASEDPDWMRSVRDLGLFYLDVMNVLGLEKVHVVGHSMGGWIAAQAAVYDCAGFASLTLIAPAGLRLKGAQMGDPFLWGAEEAVRNLYFDQRFADEVLAQPPSGEELDRLLKNRFTFAKLAWQPRLFDPDLEKWLRRVQVPAQVIWGSHDKLIPPQYAELWAQRLPQAEAKRIADAGHLPHVERPHEVARLVRELAQ